MRGGEGDTSDEMSEREITFTLSPKDDFSKVFEKNVKEAFAEKIKALTKDIKDASDKNKAIKSFITQIQR